MKKLTAIILVMMLVMVNITLVNAKVPDQKEITKYLDEVSKYELENIKNPSYGSIGGEWATMGLARYGTITDSFVSTYKTNLTNELKACKGILSTRKYTEYARVVIALTAIEENPESFAGYNLLRPLAELDNVTSQGANGILYTLIALDCGGYEVPEPNESYEGERTTREKLVNMILGNQLEDGGWSLMGTKSDTDVTAIAIQALAPYYKEEKVKKAVDKGLDRLGELQQKDGGYKTGEFANCESTAQVLTALSVMSVSIEDSRFVKNGNTVIDGLMQYYHSGAFSHFVDGDANQMATEQAMFALTSYYRSISGMNGLFEMKDGITKRVLSSEKSSETSNSKSTNNSTKKSADKRKNKTSNSKNTESKSTKSNETQTTNNIESNANKIEESSTKIQKTTEVESETILETDEYGETVTLAENKKVEETKKAANAQNRNDMWIVVSVLGLIIIGVAGYIVYKREKIKK